jgi:hypothetical protein
MSSWLFCSSAFVMLLPTVNRSFVRFANPFSTPLNCSVYFLFERAIPRSGEPASALDASLFSSDTTRLGDGRNIACKSLSAVAFGTENSTVLQYSSPEEVISLIVVVIKASRLEDRAAVFAPAAAALVRFGFDFPGELITVHSASLCRALA